MSSSTESSTKESGARSKLRHDASKRVEILGKELENCSFNRVGYEWCHTSNRKPNKAGGYVQINFDGVKPYLIHQLSWMHSNNREPPNPRAEEHLTISHKCDNSLCFNADHLCEESNEDNNRRKGCLVYTLCAVCDNTDQCLGRGIAIVCPHRPRCVRSHSEFKSNQDMETTITDNSDHYLPKFDNRDNSKENTQSMSRTVIRDRRAAVKQQYQRNNAEIPKRRSSIDTGKTASQPEPDPSHVDTRSTPSSTTSTSSSSSASGSRKRKREEEEEEDEKRSPPIYVE